MANQTRFLVILVVVDIGENFYETTIRFSRFLGCHRLFGICLNLQLFVLDLTIPLNFHPDTM